MKKLFLLSVVVGLLGVGLVYYSNSEAEKYESQVAAEKANQLMLAKQVDFLARIGKNTDRASLLAMESELNLFDKSFKDAVLPHLNLRIAVVTLADADDKFERARALQVSLVLPPEPPSPEPPNPMYPNGQPPQPPPPKIHPSVQAIVDQAIPLYEDAKKRIDKVQEQKGDSNFNYSLHYLKGEVYFRHLQILATKETQQELFRQTMNEYKLALRERPGDVDTSINIEILIKEGQGGGGGGDDPNGRRNKMLNQTAGFGRTKGN